MKFDLAQFVPLLPGIAAAFAPMLTEVVKNVSKKLSASIPTTVKPLVSIVAGAVLAGLADQVVGDPSGSSSVLGGLVGLAGSVGFSQGKKS